jgi:hypothetical protein
MADLGSLFDWFERQLQQRKRKKRVARALTFPMLDARIVHATPALTKELKFEIQLSYRFEVSGEAAYGSAFSEPVDSENYAHMLAGQIPHDAIVKIRYNPADSFENYALAHDNPSDLKGLPFHLAE